MTDKRTKTLKIGTEKVCVWFTVSIHPKVDDPWELLGQTFEEVE
tara:strand:+ start:2806 stop:2937 length:132 start_codon:yes stop_codon:yes gene_type:complete